MNARDPLKVVSEVLELHLRAWNWYLTYLTNGVLVLKGVAESVSPDPMIFRPQRPRKEMHM